MNKVTGSTLVRFLPAALLALVVALPLLIMFGSNGATMEEGSLLIGGELVLKGQIPNADFEHLYGCLLYTSPSPRDQRGSRMPSSA